MVHYITLDTVKMIANTDISSYQRWVRDYYAQIQDIGNLPSSDFKVFLDDENSLHQGEFNTMAAVGQLWSYVTQVGSILCFFLGFVRTPGFDSFILQFFFYFLFEFLKFYKNV